MRKKLKVVLKEDIENLGLFGDIKEVTAGFARNYLVPQGKALFFKDPQSKQILQRKEQIEKDRAKEVEKIKETAGKLDGVVVTVKAKVGAKGKLFGSIGAEEIIENLAKEHKIKLEKKQIQMQPIKEVGEKEIIVKLGYNIDSKIKIKVEQIEK